MVKAILLALTLSGLAQASSFTDGHPLWYGAMRVNISATTTGYPFTITNTGTYYEIFNMNQTYANGCTVSAAPYENDIKVLHGGLYLINATVCMTLTNTKLYDFAVMVNNNPSIVQSQQAGPTGSNLFSVPLTGLLRLNAGDELCLQVRGNDAGTQRVNSANLLVFFQSDQ